VQTHYAASIDGSRIAYDVSGHGPGLLLFHGAGKTRKDWHTLGYVEKLRSEYTVVTIDTRGQGESDFLTEAAQFAMDFLVKDFLSVADACGLGRFHAWGYSFGGGLARYLAACSDRVISLTTIGAPFTHASDPETRPFFEGLLKKWEPIVKGYRAGTLSEEQLKAARDGRVPVWAACFEAMRTWPRVSPRDVRCPTLLLAGTRNEQVMQWIKQAGDLLSGSAVSIEYLDGLNHEQELTEVDRSLPILLAFLRRHGVD
jgi:pimeloyl-ACP methyl ester carboxylesterase